MKKFLQFLHAAGLNASIKNTEEALTWARSGNLSADQITELASSAKTMASNSIRHQRPPNARPQPTLAAQPLTT